MKGRESGMPAQDVWDGFFSPAKTIQIMEVDETVSDIVEFGCGYGTFTIPAAKIVKGIVYAVDIETDMVQGTKEESGKAELSNVNVALRDFMTNGTGLKDTSVDYAMLFNILHIEHPETLLREAWRVLKRGGKLGIIHWRYDSATPRGPSMAIRPKPEQCVAWAEEAGFHKLRQHELPPYHYGIVMEKE